MSSSKNIETSSKKTHKKKHSSSTKAHRGSSKGKAEASYTAQTNGHENHLDGEQLLDRFMEDERDYKSYIVEEFDEYQQEARRKHEEELEKIVKKEYWGQEGWNVGRDFWKEFCYMNKELKESKEFEEGVMLHMYSRKRALRGALDQSFGV